MSHAYPTNGLSSQQQQWHSETMLNLYIHDYLKKRNLAKTAEVLRQEANIAYPMCTPIDAQNGFLLDWWNVFWDIFSAKSSKYAASKECQLYLQVSRPIT